MAPHEGLVHPKEYDIKDSNVELIGSDLDHKVKYNSAATEPAWQASGVQDGPGLWVWRIEDFEVVPWPKDKYGEFHEGDSYIVVNAVLIGKDENQKLIRDIFFWLGSHTSQDEAGTAAYKTVELDELFHGAATQHREVQEQMSEDFISLFPRISILRGGVKSGFTHVEEEAPKDVTTLLRIFKHPAARKSDSIMVVEVEPHWKSLDDDDVFVLDKGEKIYVWQGKKCSPMEKAKAAQVVHDLTLAKHIDVEVLSQATDARSKIVIDLLKGEGEDDVEMGTQLQAKRPVLSPESKREDSIGAANRSKKLFRISDSGGSISLNLEKEGENVTKGDLDSNDVFLFDTGKVIWVWDGSGASKAERAAWIRIAQAYVRKLQESDGGDSVGLVPVAKVNEGNESPAFLKAIEAM